MENTTSLWKYVTWSMGLNQSSRILTLLSKQSKYLMQGVDSFWKRISSTSFVSLQTLFAVKHTKKERFVIAWRKTNMETSWQYKQATARSLKNQKVNFTRWCWSTTIYFLLSFFFMHFLFKLAHVCEKLSTAGKYLQFLTARWTLLIEMIIYMCYY